MSQDRLQQRLLILLFEKFSHLTGSSRDNTIFILYVNLRIHHRLIYLFWGTVENYKLTWSSTNDITSSSRKFVVFNGFEITTTWIWMYIQHKKPRKTCKTYHKSFWPPLISMNNFRWIICHFNTISGLNGSIGYQTFSSYRRALIAKIFNLMAGLILWKVNNQTNNVEET